MSLTMKEVTKLDLIKEGELLTDENALEQAVVEWVSVMEMPVENFVRKNEFVLSTGIGCEKKDELFYQFVQEIIDSGASGLGIAIGRYIHTVPEEILTLANKHKFPIITLPWEIRFADVLHVVMEALKKEEARIVKQYEKVQQELLNTILNNGNLSDIASYMAEKLNKPVIITDVRGRIKGQSKNAASLGERWNHYLVSAEYDAFLTDFETTYFTTSPHAKIIHVLHSTMLQFPIQSASEIQGFLIVDEFDQEQDTLLEQETLLLLEHAMTAVALCFLKENTILETEMKLRDDFVWSLAKQETSSWDDTHSRAKTLNYNLQLPYICIIGFPENLVSIYEKKGGSPSYEHWSQYMTRRMEDEIYYTAKLMELQVMYTFGRDNFIIYLEMDGENSVESTNLFLEQLQTRLDQLIPDVIISWGISKTAGIQTFRESYQEAFKALEIGRRQNGIGQTYRYSDTRLNRALLLINKEDELKEIIEQTIGSLLKYDKERGIDLVRTFITYSRNKGNVSQTARELNLHRQSLLYRLRKIEKLTDCSLDNPDEVFLIDFCIRLWMLGNLD